MWMQEQGKQQEQQQALLDLSSYRRRLKKDEQCLKIGGSIGEVLLACYCIMFCVYISVC